MVHERKIGGVRQILVPTDFSELSARAVEYARDQAEDADLIVMATHSRTGLTRMLEGSVTEEVLRLAPCPVLALRG